MKNIIEPIKSNRIQGNFISGSVVASVLFLLPLTPNERDYITLVARTNFFQLVRIAHYMNEGLTLKQSVTKFINLSK